MEDLSDIVFRSFLRLVELVHLPAVDMSVPCNGGIKNSPSQLDWGLYCELRIYMFVTFMQCSHLLP